MQITVTNTLGRRKEVFRPWSPPTVGMYVCGPTVYDYVHIGHARTFVAFDGIKRYLWLRGFSVTHVQNITDIDDKIIKRASELGVDWKQVSETYSRDYLELLERLRVRVDVHPRVTDHIGDIIKFVQGLIDKGYAYVAPSGSVYFDVDRYPDYGHLSGNASKSMWDQGEEITSEKRHPYDFALWKAAKPGEPWWESPWGRGRPGWHIECSVMSTRYLGPKIDIHGGGSDLIFPHHENERAQSEGLLGDKWVKYWLHTGMLTIRGEKMSKSLGNIIGLRDALKEWGPEAIRMWVLSAHYRSVLEYSEQSLSQARRLVERLRDIAADLARRLSKETYSHYVKESELATLFRVRELLRKWHEAMSDDFNMGQAVSYVWEFTNTYYKEVASSESAAVLALSQRVLTEFNRVYAVADDLLEASPVATETGVEDSLVDLLVEVRSQLRKSKMYDLADYIRLRLSSLGFLLMDKGDKTEWKKVTRQGSGNA
ncbi:MAG: cysteinyl-tRNA synthetase [uncultured Acidilobus sp. OSP8]|nr:MAG: cysteinyl-tRNA synthetase [uncultured Acidilobus sp. OSP8]